MDSKLGRAQTALVKSITAATTRNQEHPMEHIVSCPQPGCGAAAEIKDRWVWLSTHGPVSR